ncbi:hypothetical protein N185_24330 [Sinorhizobium sp. GW3]|nr:hypothetical protein N185_24330 [Sinorhizobium sp. GW3]
MATRLWEWEAWVTGGIRKGAVVWGGKPTSYQMRTTGDSPASAKA